MSRPIDADALREQLQWRAYDDWNQGVVTSWADAYREVIDMIDDMPSVEPSAQSERKKGKWIFIESIYKRDGWNADIYRCDQCNRKIQMRVVLKRGEDITDYKRYCESCGALMEGVDDKRVSD